MLEVRLLGHPQFSIDGAPVKLAKRAVTIPLAAYLLLHRDEAISRQFLAFTLWANEPEDVALSELRRYVYLLNKALQKTADGTPWIHADDDVLRWQPGRDGEMRLDVADFERLSGTPETFAQAVSVYGGDLLEDTYDDWIVSYRERLRGSYLAALGGLITRHREAREFGKAADYATQLLAADPWREDVVRQLMACRYEAGDGAGALNAYEDFAKRLRAELGVEPMPETIVARDAVRRNAPLPATLGTPQSADEPRTESRTTRDILAFAGREAELEQLRAAWARAARGNGNIVFVNGEAGAGKSRLVAELARRVEAEGGRVCIGTTTYAERFPYEGIVEALHSSLPYVASVDLDPLRTAIIAQLLPEIAAWHAPLAAIPPLDPAREQARLLDALAVTIEQMAKPRPLLIVLEDLHWAGAATVAAIAFLARRFSRAAVLIVGTYREEEVGRMHPLRTIHRDLRGERAVQTIALRPLSQAAVAQIVASLPVAPDKRAGIARLGYERSEGNPLFLTEALRELTTTDSPKPLRADAWSGTDVLRSLIAARLDSLSEEGRAIADLAAVAGHAFHLDILRDVAGIDESKVLDGIYELMDRHLVREAGARRRYDFAFTHHLIHAAVYESVDPATRVRRHRRIAGILQEQSPDARGFGAADLALHRERGGDPEGAAESYVDAAQNAAGLFANEDVIGHASRAIELAREERTRARALLLRERAFGRSGRRDEQLADIQALDALGKGAGSDELAWETVVRRLRFERARGDSKEQDEAVTRLERLAESSGDQRRRAQALLARADYLGWLTRPAQAEAPATDALAIYDAIDDRAGQVEALALLAEIATNTGDNDRSRSLLATLRSRAEEQADKAVVLRALSAASVVALQQRRIDDAAALATEGLALSRAIGDREEEASTLQRLATVATWQHDFDGSRRLFADVAAVMQAIGDQRGLSHALANQFVLAMRLGLLDEADRLASRVLEIVERTGERRPLAVTKVNLSLNQLLRGDGKSAKRLALEGLEIAREIKFPLFEGAALSNLGNAERVLGALDAGLRHIKAGLAMRKPLLAPTDLLDDYCDLAVGHVQAGKLEGAREMAIIILDVSGESTAGAFWPHYCYWAVALVRRATGDAAGAKEMLDRALIAMDAFAANVADPETRTAFLALPLCREVAAAHRRDEWPPHADGTQARYTRRRRHTKM